MPTISPTSRYRLVRGDEDVIVPLRESVVDDLENASGRRLVSAQEDVYESFREAVRRKYGYILVEFHRARRTWNGVFPIAVHPAGSHVGS